MVRFLGLLLLVLTVLTSSGQKLFENEKAMALVRTGANKVYKIQMDSAQYYANKVEKMLPNHPVVPAMEAFIIMWQHIPVLRDSVFDSFHRKLEEVIQKSQAMDRSDPEAIFFEMAARGLLAEYWADQGQYMKAFGEANKTYDLIKIGFNYVDEYPEFLFIVGLYNYFRDAYPVRHPVYKPLLWFFKDGDMELGLDQIHRATKESALSRVEAYVYLIYIYLRYEETPKKALGLAGELLGYFPNNPYVQTKYVETVAACGQYHLIPDSTLQMMMNGERTYYQVVGNVYQGIKLEKTGDPTMALRHYQMGIGVGELIPNFGHFYKSLAWLGMGRIHVANGQPDKARQYLEKALEMAQTDEVKKEASKLKESLSP